MTFLSKLDRTAVFIGSTGFVIGLGLGFFIEQCLLWNRQVGRFNEVLRRLAIIEDEIRQLRVKLKDPMKKSVTEMDGLLLSPSVRNIIVSTPSSDDEFMDPDVDFDEYMSVTSDLSTTSGTAASEKFFKEIDVLLSGSSDDNRKAYQYLRDRRVKLSDNVEFLWRWARTGYLMFDLEGGATNEMAKQYLYEAYYLIERAVRLDDDSASAHKWFAIIFASVGECEGTQAKIKNGYDFKTHIERAIELDPSDYEAYYLKGRFCYGVYMLSWLERKMAAALFATPPTATIEDAVEAFLQCENLAPDRMKRNQLYLGRCYIELRDIPQAVSWLKKASETDGIDEFDRHFQKEILELLTKYEGQ